MAGEPLLVVILVAVLACVLLLIPGAQGTARASSAAVQYFRLDPGTPTQTGGSFDIPVFVIGEPAGSSANLSETRQAWQDLQVNYLNETPGPLTNWSVSTWGPGRFDLQLVLTATEIGAVDGGQALLALNSSVVVDSSVVGAAGIVDGPVLSSSIVVGAWWNTLLGIPTPPPDPTFSSLQGIIGDLAWFGSSTAGRAAYAATTIVAVMLYLWEGHKLARAKIVGQPSAPRKEAA
ncbi:MAG: hypothetical protein ACYDDZ_06620 [Acidimicrobiales bacterium]